MKQVLDHGRWRLAADMNGVTTISDVGLWLKWVFFAPGDAALLFLMTEMPGLAQFLELGPSHLNGWLSGLVSLVVWIIASVWLTTKI